MSRHYGYRTCKLVSRRRCVSMPLQLSGAQIFDAVLHHQATCASTIMMNSDIFEQKSVFTSTIRRWSFSRALYSIPVRVALYGYPNISTVGDSYTVVVTPHLVENYGSNASIPLICRGSGSTYPVVGSRSYSIQQYLGNWPHATILLRWDRFASYVYTALNVPSQA